MVKTIALNFDGYYEEKDLPPIKHECPGIYIVFRGDQENITELLYIGRSGDAANRPGRSHHKYWNWRKCLQRDEVLYFSFADTEYEERAEAALIYEIQPRCNESGKYGFHYPETSIIISGQSGGPKNTFTVQSADD